MKAPLLFTLILAFVCHYTQRAQDSTVFKKGTLVITTGIGLPDYYRTSLRTAYRGHSNLDVYGFGPLIVKGDYGIMKFKWGHSIGAGMVLGFSTSTVKYNDLNTSLALPANYRGKDVYRTFTVGARGTYHFYTTHDIDCYASIGLGFNINTVSQTASSVYLNAHAPLRSWGYSAFTAGARYYFTKTIGVYAEAGWDMSTLIQGGLALKF
ncbi:MAG: hypothetical protein V4580_19575 [Bacteroidota bacterium]